MRWPSPPLLLADPATGQHLLFSTLKAVMYGWNILIYIGGCENDSVGSPVMINKFSGQLGCSVAFLHSIMSSKAHMTHPGTTSFDLLWNKPVSSDPCSDITIKFPLRQHWVCESSANNIRDYKSNVLYWHSVIFCSSGHLVVKKRGCKKRGWGVGRGLAYKPVQRRNMSVTRYYECFSIRKI